MRRTKFYKKWIISILEEMIKILLLIVYLLGCCSSANAEAKSREDLIRFSTPQKAELDNCFDAECISVSYRKVCRCKLNDSESELRYYKGDKLVTQWKQDLLPYGLLPFEVMSCDMDSDEKKELVIASLEGVSNGMAVNYWSLYIIDDKIDSQSFLEFGVEDYGNGSISWDDKARRCLVLHSSWEELDDLKRGPGLYLVGRWFKYNSGALNPVEDRRILARRYLFSFAKERGKGAPLKWLSHTKTEKYTFDPIIQRLAQSKQIKGTICNVTRKSLDEGLNITLETKSGERLAFVYPGDYNDARIVERIVSLESGTYRAYPQGYFAADPVKWLTGKYVIVSPRLDETIKQERAILIIEPSIEGIGNRCK